MDTRTVTLPAGHDWKSIESGMADTDSFMCETCAAQFHAFHNQDGTVETEYMPLDGQPECGDDE